MQDERPDIDQRPAVSGHQGLINPEKGDVGVHLARAIERMQETGDMIAKKQLTTDVVGRIDQVERSMPLDDTLEVGLKVVIRIDQGAANWHNPRCEIHALPKPEGTHQMIALRSPASWYRRLQ